MLTLGIEDELTEEEELVCGNFLIFCCDACKAFASTSRVAALALDIKSP